MSVSTHKTQLVFSNDPEMCHFIKLEIKVQRLEKAPNLSTERTQNTHQLNSKENKHTQQNSTTKKDEYRVPSATTQMNAARHQF